MANPIADIYIVLKTCGVSVEATRTLIINIKSLTLITDFGFLDGGDDDVTAMSLRMAHHIANNGCVILGGIYIKKIQALVWWFRDCHNLGQPTHVALWTASEMTNSGIAKRIENYQPKADMKSAEVKAFNPDDFETHEDAFRNLLSQMTSVTKTILLALY